MEWRGELLRAGGYAQDGGPDGNDGLYGAGRIGTGPVHPQDVQQLYTALTIAVNAIIFMFDLHGCQTVQSDPKP